MTILPGRGEYQVIVTEFGNDSKYTDYAYPGCTIKLTLLDGKLHSIGDEAAYVAYDQETGAIVAQHWYKNGMRHRANGLPAIIQDFKKQIKDGLVQHMWCLDDTEYKDMYFSKKTGHPRTIIYSNFLDDGSDFFQTICRYDEETGELKSTKYQRDLKDVKDENDIQRMPFPAPEPFGQ